MDYSLPCSSVHGILQARILEWQRNHAAAAAKSLQSCPTLCDPIDGSPPGSPIPGILQARTLEWVAISFSNAWKWRVKVKSLGRVRHLETPWTAAHQAPPSMGFSRQEYWSGVSLPSLKGTIVTKKYECENSILLEEELKRAGCKSFGASNSGGECWGQLTSPRPYNGCRDQRARMSP